MPPRHRYLDCLCRLALYAFALGALPCFGCPAERTGHPLLGEYRTEVAGAVLLHVQQNDLDVEILAHIGSQTTLHDAPNGRNGAEWIYVDAPRETRAELCIYAVYGQSADGSYTVSRFSVPATNRPLRATLQAMSDGGRMWAEATEDSRRGAIHAFERAFRGGQSWLGVSDRARLASALARTRRYQYDRALVELRSIAQGSVTPDDIAYAAQREIGFILNRQGDFRGSVVALDVSLARAGAAQTRMRRSLRRDIAEITNLLGEAHLSAGDLDAGALLLMQARTQASDDHQLLGMVHNNLGYVHLLQADRDEVSRRPMHLSSSLQEHFTARYHSLAADDRQELAIIENNLASVFERMGDLRQARQRYEEALRLIDRTDDPLRLHVLYFNLGNIYQYLGDYEKSASFLAASLTRAAQAAPQTAVRLRCSLGTTRRLMGHVSEAIREHDACLNGARSGQDVRAQVEALRELTADYRVMGRTAEAWQTVRAAVELLPKLRDADQVSSVLVHFAELLQQHGDAAMARAKIVEANAVAAGARYPTSRIDALVGAMDIHAAQGRDREATAYGREAMSAIESVHAHLEAERLGPAWSARTGDVHARIAAQMIRTAHGPHRDERLWSAIGVIERARAISLRQQLSVSPRALQQVKASPVLETLSEIADAQARKDASGSGLPLAYYHQHDLLTLTRLAGVGELPVPPPLSGKVLQSSLGTQEVALYYFFAGDTVYLFLITRSQLQLVEIGSRGAIEAHIARLRADLARRTPLVPSLRNLSAALLPKQSLPPATTWIVVRDGGLASVPFAALHVGAEGDDYDPAMAHYSIKLVPSLSAYFMRKEREPAKHGFDLAVLADPVFREGAGAPAGWTQTLSRLPWSAREAQQLTRLFPADRALIYTGERATRTNLRSEGVRNARVLHIASHGYFRSEDPDNIGFALAPTEGSGRYDSGFVTLTELFTYRFNNDLVVISGCDSALGAQRAGEGALSLTRGFIAQGAAHVVSTLWPVADRASAEFMGLFYERLVAGRGVAHALRESQQALSSRPAYRDPFYWGAYSLTSVEPSEKVEFVH